MGDIKKDADQTSSDENDYISEVKNTLGWDKQITGRYIRKGW